MTRIAALAAAILLAPSCTHAVRAQSCTAELGARRAQALVNRCVEISPATHPPCNASNPCDLIRSEITRGCSFAGDDKPDWCGEYSDDP